MAELKVGDYVEKHVGEARWKGVIVAAYETLKGSKRYVVEVLPQGFQMIAVPKQLRKIAPPTKRPVFGVYDTYGVEIMRVEHDGTLRFEKGQESESARIFAEQFRRYVTGGGHGNV